MSASCNMRNMLWGEAMEQKRRIYSPEFKANLALAAIQGDLTFAELVKKFDVHAKTKGWNRQLSNNGYLRPGRAIS